MAISIIFVSLVLVSTAIGRCSHRRLSISGWLIARSELKLALPLWLIPCSFLLAWCRGLSDWGLHERCRQCSWLVRLSHKYVFAVWVEVVKRQVIDPNLLQPETWIELDSIVKLRVCWWELWGANDDGWGTTLLVFLREVSWWRSFQMLEPFHQ